MLENSIFLNGVIPTAGITTVTELESASVSADDGETSTVPYSLQPRRVRREGVNVDLGESSRIYDPGWASSLY